MVPLPAMILSPEDYPHTIARCFYLLNTIHTPNKNAWRYGSKESSLKTSCYRNRNLSTHFCSSDFMLCLKCSSVSFFITKHTTSCPAKFAFGTVTDCKNFSLSLPLWAEWWNTKYGFSFPLWFNCCFRLAEGQGALYIDTNLHYSFSVTILLLTVVRDNIEKEGQHLVQTSRETVSHCRSSGWAENQSLKLLRDHWK